MMVGYSYMNPHLFFRLYKFSNKSILHSRIRSIIYLVDDINYFMILYIILNGMIIKNKLLKYTIYYFNQNILNRYINVIRKVFSIRVFTHIYIFM